MSIEGTPSPSPSSQHYVPTMTKNPPQPDQKSTHAPPVSKLARNAANMSKASIDSICGGLAGVASGIVTCPLDVIKTRLQAQGSFRPRDSRRPAPGGVLYNGLIPTAKQIWREDKVRGMYRGLGPMLLGYLPTWAVYMSTYERSKERYYQHIENPFVARMAASVTAGACSTLVTNPIWVIKTRLMSQVSDRASQEHRPPWHYKSTLDAARKMYRTEGVLSFYSGLSPALLGLTHVAIQFPLYEFFKTEFTGLEMGQNTPTDQKSHWLGVSAATFLSKLCATSATYPHEVLRTRLQTQQRSTIQHPTEGIAYRGGHSGWTTPSTRPPGTASSDGMINLPRYRGIYRTCRTILQEEGWRAFYNGMGTNMIRAIPAAMTTMLTFETLKTHFYRLRKEGQRELGPEA